MEPCLAAQAVEIKLNFKEYTALLSDYEFAYALGRGAALAGLSNPGSEAEPGSFQEVVLAALETYPPKDDKEQHLLQMLRDYKPLGIKAPELSLLIKMGYCGKTTAS